MNAQEAEAAYRITKSQLDAGQITLEEYNKKIAELRYLDNTGTWWTINPADGSWLKWTGSAWVPAFAPAVPVTPQAPVQPAPQPATRQPAVQQPVQKETTKPSWYIPPVSSQQKPAAAQPATSPPLEQPAQQPVEQPATSSYYIPPVGSVPQASAQQPAAAVAQPAAGVTVKPARNWAGIGSLVLGILSWIFFPVLLGIIAIAAGIAGLYMAKKQKSKIPVTAIIGIILGLLSIIINIFWLDIFPAPQVLPPIK